MFRNGSPRPLVLSLCLMTAILGLSAMPAEASHHRYAHISWERDFSHSVPNEYKVIVTIDSGARWSFPYGTTVPSNQWGCPAGFVPTPGGTGTGSCPFLNSTIGHGTVTFNKAVRINGAATNVTSVPHRPTVNTILQNLDLFYGKFTFSMVFPVSSNPVQVIWQDCCRVSTLRDGNADQNWRVAAIINVAPPNTKSPKSTSLPLINVTTNQLNTVFIPSVAFDNSENRFRLATAAESSLVTIAPAGFAVSAVDHGIVTFTPTVVGLYAVQLIVTNYGSDGVPRNSVPLDLIFSAAAPAPGNPTVSLTTPNTVVTANVGSPITIPITATLSPATAGYVGTINNTPLPSQPAPGLAGAALISNASGNGLQPIVANLTWTPNLASSGSVVCFQATFTSGSSAVTSPGMLCVTINLGALQTTLVAQPATGAASGPVKFTAKLTRTIDNFPLQDREVQFTVPNPPSAPLTATASTNSTGFATATITVPNVISASYEAKFNAVVNEFLQSSSDVSTIVTRQATTSLDAPVVPPLAGDPLPSVGFPLAVSAVLNRHFTDGGLFGVGQAGVTFTLTSPPSGATATIAGGNTSAGGVSVGTFPAPQVTGQYSVIAEFPGNANLFGSVPSGSTAFTVRQRVQLTLSPVIGAEDHPVPVSATFKTIPSDQPLAGRTVTFTFSGMTPALPQQTAVTDVNGVATVNATFADQGTFTVTASTPLVPANLEANQHGHLTPETVTGNASIVQAVPTTLLIAPVTAISGQQTTTIARLTTSADLPLSDVTVAFSIVNGASLGNAQTDANGYATLSWTPGPAFTGSIKVDFASIPGYLPATATTTLSVIKAATSLSALVVPSTTFVGEPLSLTTVLTRTVAPTGIVPNADITFTLTGAAGNPGGASTATMTATTDGSGIAAVNFSLADRGEFTITASFAGSDSLASSSRSASTTVFQKTFLLVNTAHGVAGDITQVTAGLRTVPGNNPIAGQTVSFSFTGNPTPAAPAAPTDIGGIAPVNVVFPTAGDFTATATFVNLAGYFVDESGAAIASVSTAQVHSAFATTSLSAFTVPTTGFVGDALVAVTALTRTVTPVGVLPNQSITFTLTGPAGPSPAVATVPATTGPAGVAQGSFALTAPGAFTLKAVYPGDLAHIPATVSESVNVYQKTKLTLAVAGNAVAGAPVTLTATLATAPGSAAVPNQTVTFSFGGVVPDQSATTDGNGIATLVVSFPNAGQVAATASFLNVAAFFADRNGTIAAETDSLTLPVAAATTTLSAVTTPASALVDGNFAASATLSRIDAIAVAAGRTIVFTATAPGGATTQATGLTDAAGLASVSFTPTLRGVHSVTAAFAAESSLLGATSSAANVPVYQRTSIALPAVVNGTAGAPITVSATLTSVPGGAAIGGQAVDFSFTGSGMLPASQNGVVTDAAGVATITFFSPDPEAFSVHASFVNGGGHFADHTGTVPPVAETAASPVIIAPAATALSAVGAPLNALVDAPVSVSTTLTRVDSIALAAGNAVVFTVTAPGGSTSTVNGTTDAAGFASATFIPSAHGVYSVTAAFAGGSALIASSGAGATVTVYQRTSLQLPAVSGNTGSIKTLTATLLAFPGGAGVANQVIDFSFAGPGAPAGQTTTTDSNGVATINIALALPGTFTASASFSNGGQYFTNRLGAIPPVAETESASVVVMSAATSLSTPAAPGNSLVSGSLTASTTLSRNDGIAIAPGQPVVFTLTAPGGATTSITGTTDAAGSASVSFTPSVRGAHSVSATFAGDCCLVGAVSNTATVQVYQRTSIALPAAVSGTAGAPITVTATLTTVPGGAAISGEAVDFSFTGSGMLPASQGGVVTDAAGVATITFFSADPEAFAVHASFVNGGDHFADHTGAFPPIAETASAPVIVVRAATALSAVTAPANSLTAAALIASATLSRTDGLPIATGTPVVFTLTGPGGSSTVTGTTNAAGIATASFTPAASGVHAVTADFGGTSALIESTGAGASVTVYQRTSLVVPAGLTGSAAKPLTVTATLSRLGGTAIEGETVVFSFSGPGAPGTQSATTNASGVAAVTVTFPSVATYSASASFLNSAAFYTNAAGDIPVTATIGTGSVDVTNNAPTFTAPDDIVAEASSAAGADVTFTAIGSDIEDGSIAALCTANPGTFAIGTYDVDCTVTDIAGATASDSFSITVRDTTAPSVSVESITRQQTSTAGAVGTFAFSASDIVDGALTPVCTPASGSTFARGETTVECTVTDAHGNTGSAIGTVTVIDTINPVVTYSGNAGTYTVDQMVDIICTPTDSGSGVFSSTCANITGPAHTFAVGVNTRSASATDVAGNTASASTSFTVTVPPAAVGNVITQMVDSPAEAAKMNHTLGQATSAPNANARAAHLNKLVKDIEKEIGKTLTAAEAATLIALLQQLY